MLDSHLKGIYISINRVPHLDLRRERTRKQRSIGNTGTVSSALFIVCLSNCTKKIFKCIFFFRGGVLTNIIKIVVILVSFVNRFRKLFLLPFGSHSHQFSFVRLKTKFLVKIVEKKK